MKDFDVNFYLDGCRLSVEIGNGTPSTYIVLFNSSTETVSKITKVPNNSTEFNLDEDGIYQIYLFDVPTAILNSKSELIVNNQLYDAQKIVDEWEGFKVLTSCNFFEELFCICKLKKCLSDLQLKVFRDLVKNCGSSKCKNGDELKAQRDFLFLAVWLMEHLIDAGKSELVRDIFDSLQSCGSICGNLLKSNKDCGCNG